MCASSSTPGPQRALDLALALRVDRDRQARRRAPRSQSAASSPSDGVGPASAFSDTLIAVAPAGRELHRPIVAASSAPVHLHARSPPAPRTPASDSRRAR